MNQTRKDRSKRGGFIFPLLAFLLALATGFVLLVAAAVLVLASWIGSTSGAAAIVCGVCLLVALGIYLFALRRPLARMQEQLEIVCDVARVTKSVYDWIMQKVDTLRRFFALLRVE